MDDKERHSAFMSALVTEHYVLQAAASATVSEAAARSSLYVYSLSSSLVAVGFVSRYSLLGGRIVEGAEINGRWD
jgi:hypothetical protein